MPPRLVWFQELSELTAVSSVVLTSTESQCDDRRTKIRFHTPFGLFRCQLEDQVSSYYGYCSRNTVHKRGALIAEDFESKDASRDRIFFTLKLPSVHSLAVET